MYLSVGVSVCVVPGFVFTCSPLCLSLFVDMSVAYGVSKYAVSLQSCCMLVRSVCLSVVVQDIFTQNGNLCQPDRSVSVAPNIFVRVCDSGHTHFYGCLSWGGVSPKLYRIFCACVFLF